MDVGGLRTLGLGPLSLWPLDVGGWRVGMVAWSGLRLVPPVLGAGVCLLLGMGRWFWIWCRVGRLGRLRLAPARTMRLFPSVVGGIPWPVWRREYHERPCDEHQPFRRNCSAA